MADGKRELTVYVGCYTTPDRKGHGEGITAYRMDAESGEWQPLGLVAKVDNPSFLALHPNRKFLYAAHGGQMSDVSAYSIRPDGGLTQLGTWPSGGTNPVHLDLDISGRWLVVANYTAGTIAVLPARDDGSLDYTSDLLPLSGQCGPDPVEQAAPHPHDIPFDPSSSFVLVPDKGLDRVFAFRLDAERGRFVAPDPPSIAAAPGAGPRHAAFHPSRNLAYVINELNSTLTTYSYSGGGDSLRELQTLSSLPGEIGVRSTGSEVVVHPSGRFVYASNRGHNSVGVFSIQDDGTLKYLDWYSTCGDTPRAIALDPSGCFLYAANQASDTIVGYRVDDAKGELTPMERVMSTGSPSTIVFAER